MGRASAVASLPPLLPAPRHAVRHSGRFALCSGMPILLAPESDEGDFATACALRDTVARVGATRLVVETQRRCDDVVPRILLRRDGDAGDAYRLRVGSDRAELIGTGPAGLRYGVETLGQLVDRHGYLPACEIEDAPDFRFRGVLLDVSRGKVPTEAELRALVDLCLRLKLNVLMLYVEHPFRWRRHPRIGADADGLDAETLRTLDAYAAARHVELIPNLQSLGHMEHVLNLPEYRSLAETDARWTLACAEPASYALLRDLYDEFLPNFRSRIFHANCDEAWDLGRGRSQQLSESLGPGGLFVEHVRKVRDLAREHGRRTAIWADFVHAHPERLAELPPDLLLCDWWYEADFDFDRVRVFAEQGREFWVCPGTSSWNCLFPRQDNALTNVTRWADAGRRHGATGLLMTDWGDGGHYNLLGNSWLGYAWAAQQAWSGDAPRSSFDRAFGHVLFGDGSGEAARLYRELGRLHDVGFQVFNASPLQFLFFDDLDDAWFVRGIEPRVVARTLARFERVRARLAGAADRFGVDTKTYEELGYAADASILALRKALAGRRWIAWREHPDRLDARARRALARELATLAREQRELRKRLRRLWRARSRPSNFERTGRRIARSIASLLRAAGALDRNRPPAPPAPHEGFTMASVFQHLKQSMSGG
jgi:hypothetical protein